MALLDYRSRTTFFRIDYIGPAGAGVRTSLDQIRKQVQHRQGEFSNIRFSSWAAVETPRVITQAQLAIDRQLVPHLVPAGWSVEVLLWAECYPDGYQGDRKLRQSDVIVLLLDSRKNRQSFNQMMLDCLQNHYPRQKFHDIPKVIQYTHGDEEDTLRKQELDSLYNPTAAIGKTELVDNRDESAVFGVFKQAISLLPKPRPR